MRSIENSQKNSDPLTSSPPNTQKILQILRPQKTSLSKLWTGYGPKSNMEIKDSNLPKLRIVGCTWETVRKRSGTFLKFGKDPVGKISRDVANANWSAAIEDRAEVDFHPGAGEAEPGREGLSSECGTQHHCRINQKQGNRRMIFISFHAVSSSSYISLCIPQKRVLQKFPCRHPLLWGSLQEP